MERSKVFKRLGQLVGIEAKKKTQRGIIARRSLTILERYELSEFEKKLVKIEFKPLIKVTHNGVTQYI